MNEKIINKMLKLFEDEKVNFVFNHKFLSYDNLQGRVEEMLVEDVLKSKKQSDLIPFITYKFQYLEPPYYCNYDENGVITNKARFINE